MRTGRVRGVESRLGRMREVGRARVLGRGGWGGRLGQRRCWAEARRCACGPGRGDRGSERADLAGPVALAGQKERGRWLAGPGLDCRKRKEWREEERFGPGEENDLPHLIEGDLGTLE